MIKNKIFDIRKTDIARKGLCNIVTLDVLSDGRIILTDDRQNVLQLFTTEFVLISCMVLPHHKPVDMCVVEDKEDKTFTVALCFEDVKMDVQGNIYICDHDSGVHQVSAKSRRDSRILFPKAERISSIVIDMPRRRILVCHANTSFTTMYRI
ncbi:hypothetical protein DPMN_110667 [Dreissena polymorpha]|uniref:Uncharacterized protein n=1 Tax=Dreissena polymorpha TaxID=45954 RepID=A0A9D4KDE5_DREPO|nr:hypothetical protein DPMN_110667 [Dreissena polymorpha]